MTKLIHIAIDDHINQILLITFIDNLLFFQTLQMKKSVKIAIVDHISSAPAVLFPMKRIAKVKN
jgi:hypothetical protein